LAKGYEAWLKPVVEITKAAVLKKNLKVCPKVGLNALWLGCATFHQLSVHTHATVSFHFVCRMAMCAFCIGNAKHEVGRARHILKKV
jgi:hypothetical protein